MFSFARLIFFSSKLSSPPNASKLLKAIYSPALIIKLDAVVNQCRQYYNLKSDKIGLSEFETLRKNALETVTTQNREETVRQLKENLTSYDQIRQLLLLSENEKDLDETLEHFKKLKDVIPMNASRAFGEMVIKTCYIFQLPATKFVNLLNDGDVVVAFSGKLTSFILMNEMLQMKNYDLVVRVFESYLTSLKPFKIRANGRNMVDQQLIPFGHLKLVFIALLQMNTKESFLKMKEILTTSTTKFNSNPNNTSIACCFLLSILQKEYQFSYELMLKITKWNQSLAYNLRSISLCLLDRPQEAYNFIEQVIITETTSSNKRNELNGKFFPLTVDIYTHFWILEVFKRSLKKSNLLENNSTSNKYRLIIEKMKSRLFEKDLHEYCCSSGLSTSK